MKLLLPGLVLAGGAVAAHLWQAARFEATVAARAAGLNAVRPEAVLRGDLPSEIEIFARRGAAEPRPGVIRLSQVGDMRLEPAKSWSPMTAEHQVSTAETAFVWRARVRMAPLVTAHVVDLYVAGKGLLEARLFGSLRVARADSDENDRGELMRYLAELPWAPEAILYNRALRWKKIGNREFEVAADSSGGEACVRLLLNDAGDITHVEADGRPRMDGDQVVQTPWRGEFGDYGYVDSYRIPTTAEVSWLLPSGEFKYWRGEIVGVERR